jgi:hypothetical protein
VRFDGIVKTIGRYYDHRFVRFGDEFPNIRGLSRNAWDLDRNLLVGMGRETWEAVVDEVAAAITDEVIREAVGRMPAAHFALVGEQMIASLRQRRDRLAEAASELYEIIFRETDVHATDESEVALLTRTDGGGLHVSIHRRGSGSDPAGPPHFQREFSPEETRELRIYLHGGDDLIRLVGDADSPIGLRIVGGGGEDEMRASPQSGDVRFYDPDESTVLGGMGAKFVRRHAPRPYSWWVDGEEEPDFGARTWPELGVSYDPDRGLVPSVGFRRDRYGFLKDPFGTRLQLNVGWAAGRNQPILAYRHRFESLLGSGDLQLASRYSGFEVVRFYGLGNESEEAGAESYFEVHQKQLVIGASLVFGDGEETDLTIGPVFMRTSSDTTNPSTYVAEARYYGTGPFMQAGVQASFEVDQRNLTNAPTRGYRLAGGAAYYPEALDVESGFGEIHGEAATYLSPPGIRNPVLALRAGGKRLFGTFPYYDAAFLGGSRDVRGLLEQRFAGEASVYGSAELRVFLTRFRFVFPYDLGVFGLADAGRVFVEDDPADSWHTSVGGGIWLAPVIRDATVHLSSAWSEGRRSTYIGMGFAF